MWFKSQFQSSRRFRQIPTRNTHTLHCYWSCFNRAGVSARFQLGKRLIDILEKLVFQSSRRFRQIPTNYQRTGVDGDHRFNRAGVSARFQHAKTSGSGTIRLKVSIEPAFPPDSNAKYIELHENGDEGFNRAGVSARFQRRYRWICAD